jgi:hypothetical protein
LLAAVGARVLRKVLHEEYQRSPIAYTSLQESEHLASQAIVYLVTIKIDTTIGHRYAGTQTVKVLLNLSGNIKQIDYTRVISQARLDDRLKVRMSIVGHIDLAVMDYRHGGSKIGLDNTVEYVTHLLPPLAYLVFM